MRSLARSVSTALPWVVPSIVAFLGAGAIATLAATKAAVPNHPYWWLRFAYFNAAAYLPMAWAFIFRRKGRQVLARGLLGWYGGSLVGVAGALVALAVIHDIESSLASPRSVGSVIGSGMYLAPAMLCLLVLAVRHRSS